MTSKEALSHLVSGQFTWEHRMKCKEIIEKKIKALEILKDKRVDIGLLVGLMHGNEQTAFKNYNDFCDEDNLTRKEYSLLKEVLL